jgi:phosphatidate phosphatase PAH1
MRKTIQPDHNILSKMNLKLGKNQITFRIRGNFDKEYLITARMFLYDNKKPHKVGLTRSSFQILMGQSREVMS